MTQEQKNLLLKDLCSRLLYGVKAHVKSWSGLTMEWSENVYVVKSAFPSLNEVHVQSESSSHTVILGYYDYYFKPYLFPMSSMTEEQEKELNKIYSDEAELIAEHLKSDISGNIHTHRFNHHLSLNWYLENHFDIYGLIEKDLALDATGLNIY